MRVVIIDNYDSFTFNLFQTVGEEGERALVFRNDKISLAELVRLQPERLILSPGPGNPEDRRCFGICHQAILELGTSVPILGVCLGHQGIGVAFGAKVVRAPEVMHGKTSPIVHDGSALFAGIPSPFEAMRYHSLVLDPVTVPDCLAITARTSDGIVMGVAHRRHPIFGVQFHPESIGTPMGRTLVANFLRRPRA